MMVKKYAGNVNIYSTLLLYSDYKYKLALFGLNGDQDLTE